MAYFKDEVFAYGRFCSGAALPGTGGVMSWFLEAYESMGASNLGIYNCQPGNLSVHAEGRALDLGVPPTDTKWAQDLAYAIVNMSEELGIQLVIYNREMWIGGPIQAFEGFKPYTGVSPHIEHLHVELSEPMAKKSADEVKKIWTEMLAKASVERPGPTEANEGSGVSPGDGGGEETAPPEEDDTANLEEATERGVPGEEDLEGMLNYKERMEAEERLRSGAAPIEEKSLENLSIEEQRKLAALGENVNSGKTGSDYANTGVSVGGFGILLYTTVLFSLFLFDRANTITEARTLEAASFGKLGVAYDKEDEGKSSSGTNYVGWSGILKYSAVGIILGLILVSGIFFNIIERGVNLFASFGW